MPDPLDALDRPSSLCRRCGTAIHQTRLCPACDYPGADTRVAGEAVDDEKPTLPVYGNDLPHKKYHP